MVLGPVGAGPALGRRPSGLVSVGAVLVLLTMAVTIGRDYRAWLPWLIAVGYLSVTLLSVTLMRSGDHTSDAGPHAAITTAIRRS